MKRGRRDERTEVEGQRQSQGEWEVGSYPSHCSHARPHLIGWFVMSLQEEDGRPDRPVRGVERMITCMLGSDGVKMVRGVMVREVMV